MRPKSFVSLGFTFLVCLSLGVFTMGSPIRGSEASERQAKLNGGYYLLHHLCDDESNLPMLIAVKHTPADVASYVDRISKTAKESSASLERMQKGDSSLRFDKNPLPEIELDVRASIRDAKQHQLLFGTTDSDFVRALLVSQIEAGNYALHLAKVLSEQETNPDRIKTLQHMSAKWQVIYDEAYRHLKNS